MRFKGEGGLKGREGGFNPSPLVKPQRPSLDGSYLTPGKRADQGSLMRKK